MAGEGGQEEARSVLQSLGISGKALEDTVSNKKICGALVDIVKKHNLKTCSKETGALLLQVASTLPGSAAHHQDLLVQYVIDGRIASNDQCVAAVKHLRANAKEGSIDTAAFEKDSGVGITVTDAEIEAAVASAVKQHEAAIGEQRYQFKFAKLLQPVKQQGDVAWAPIDKVRAEIDKQAEQLLGPRTAKDAAAEAKPQAKPAKVKKEKSKAPAASSKENVAPKEGAEEDAGAWKAMDPYRFLPAPEENSNVHTEVQMSDGSVARYSNTREQLAAHLKATGGQVVTRFPPEPNGYLHIGHAKAMFVDFGMAAKRGGKCYLRFDDTNPEKESMEFIEHIKEIVAWMGWTYCAVTHSSDYFEQLYQFALQLIRAGKAYVCHQAAEEIKAAREAGTVSPWRDRPPRESLRLFEDMRRGLYDEGKATLRLHMDPGNANRNMDDLVAYRIKFAPHPHVGAAWCIYPSYDYTHCVVDSLEHVTHSLCTLEFESRRASYYWLLDALGIYMPLVWEYSRLNLTNNVMSKRKLQLLVGEGHVRGWDDPRLPTLAGMRRRGITPDAINMLCHEVGITRSDNEIPLHKLLHHVRAHLDETSPRALAVLRPLRLVITNWPEGKVEMVQAADFPGRGDAGYEVPCSAVCYIEQTDFKARDEKGYYGLAPGKSVMLRYAYPVTYESHSCAADGSVAEVRVTYDPDFLHKGKPPKGVLNWVAQPQPGTEPATAEARLYSETLFKSKSPGDLEDWLGDLDTHSEEVVSQTLISKRLEGCQAGDRFQFERLGYFCVDQDSSSGHLVFNRTCTLRDLHNRSK